MHLEPFERDHHGNSEQQGEVNYWQRIMIASHHLA
jgi:hypothetical protein